MNIFLMSSKLIVIDWINVGLLKHNERMERRHHNDSYTTHIFSENSILLFKWKDSYISYEFHLIKFITCTSNFKIDWFQFDEMQTSIRNEQKQFQMANWILIGLKTVKFWILNWYEICRKQNQRIVWIMQTVTASVDLNGSYVMLNKFAGSYF